VDRIESIPVEESEQFQQIEDGSLANRGLGRIARLKCSRISSISTESHTANQEVEKVSQLPQIRVRIGEGRDPVYR